MAAGWRPAATIAPFAYGTFIAAVPAGLVELDTQIKALAFAPDGRSLFTGNGTTSCYQIEVRQILASGIA